MVDSNQFGLLHGRRENEAAFKRLKEAEHAKPNGSFDERYQSVAVVTSV